MSGPPVLPSTAATMTASAVAAMRGRLGPLLEGPVPHGRERHTLRAQLARELDDAIQRTYLARSPEERGELEARVKVLRARRLRVERRGLRPEVLPESGDPIGDGWTSCRIDVDAVFREVEGLWLRPGFRLCAYVYREGNNGFGVVRALPPSAPPPPLLIEHRAPRSAGPHPAGARPFEEALDGDGSARSYLLASILLREMGEMGALWHDASWSEVKVVDRPPGEPWVRAAGFPPDLDWTPRSVIEPGGEVTVTLHTSTRLETEAIIRHVDRYRSGSYVPLHPLRGEQIASGGEGYIH